MTEVSRRLILALPGGQKQEFALAAATVAIGRGAANDVVLRDPKVSRTHARIDCGNDGCYLVNLGSANGTRLNGNCVERAPLRPGDIVMLGASELTFDAGPPGEDADLTQLQGEEDLEATMLQSSLVVQVADTRTARLAVHTPGRTWEVPFAGDSITIGRHDANDIVLQSPKISRYHARIERRGDAYIVHDLQSDNGTWMGGRRITTQTLAEGDTVRIGDARLVFKPAFTPEELTVVEPAENGKRRLRPVVIIPGIMGSVLWRGGEKVWPSKGQILRDPEAFMYREGEPPFEARGLVDENVIIPNVIKQEQYGSLIDFLEETLGYERNKTLLEFAYDFRFDVRFAARCLAEAIEKWGVKDPITILAHSMGSLVSRYYVERLGGRKKVERLVFMGGPHAGAPKALTSLLVGPKVLPFGLFGSRLRGLMASFPSSYELLPCLPCGTDQHGNKINWLHDETWLPEPQRHFLKTAREFRAELGTRSSVPTVCIFGYGLKTITDVNVIRDAGGCCTKTEYRIDQNGDGTVTEPSAILDATEIHPVEQFHGTLHVDNDVKKRLVLELTR